MNRRDALRLFAASACSLHGWETRAELQAPGDGKFAHADTDLFVDQSGIFGRDHFVVGTLSVSDIEPVVLTLQKLRKQTKFACRLHYSSRNKFKAPYAKAALDYWLDSAPMTIRVAAIENARGGDSESQTEKDSRYIEQVAALVNMRQRPPVSRIVTQRRQTGPRGSQLEQRLLKASRNVQQIVNIPDGDSDLLQFLGLVTGTIYGAFNESEQRPTNRTKRELMAYLESKLGGKTLWMPRTHPKLDVRVVAKA